MLCEYSKAVVIFGCGKSKRFATCVDVYFGKRYIRNRHRDALTSKKQTITSKYKLLLMSGGIYNWAEDYLFEYASYGVEKHDSKHASNPES